MRFLRNRFKASRIFNFNQVERDRWVARQAAKIPPESRVLDMGAGSCPYRRLFGHCEYKTQDFESLDPVLLLDRAYGAIDYRCDVTQVPVPDASFDAILCTEVLEHVPEPIAVLKEISRILKPGGIVLLTAPLGSGIHQAPYHFYGGYTPFWYERFLKQFSFTEIKIEPNGGFFKHYGQESIRMARFLAPWRLNTNIALRILCGVFWLALLPWFLIVCPIACYFLDRLDAEKGFTIGYHVRAVRH